MKIENLKYFLSVMRTGSMNKAAEELYLTPQNLGLIIKGMEKELGEELFHRTAKGVKPTEAGEKLVPYAMNIINQYDEYLTNIGVIDNILNFYTTPALAKEVVGQMHSFEDTQYYISVHKKSPNDLKELLLRGEKGIYFFGVMDKDMDSLNDIKQKYIIFSENEVWNICHKSNPLLKHDVITTEHLMDYLLLMSDSYDARKYYRKGFRYLQIDDIEYCKKTMREKEAIYNVQPMFYYKYFNDFDEWPIVQKKKTPEIHFILLFHKVNFGKLLQQKIFQIVESSFPNEYNKKAIEPGE